MSNEEKMPKSGKITVEEFIKKGCDEPVYIHTFNGWFEVSHIRWPETNPWAVTPKANGGFGCSWCVHYGTPLYRKSALVTEGLL